MKYIDILAGFETEIGMIDDPIAKPATDDSLFWLNQAVGKFMKLRFNGDFIHKLGFEQTEKRRSDLIKLFLQCKYTFSEPSADSPHDPNLPGIGDWDGPMMSSTQNTTDNHNVEFSDVIKHKSYNEYPIEYPNDFLFALNEDVVISDKDGNNQMDTCVFECTRDSFMYRVNNSLTDFHYNRHRARPIRIRDAKGCSLLTDGKYDIKLYTLGYLRKPNEITLEDPYGEYNDFEDVVMNEIIKMAALMYLENTKNERYKTISEEVLTQE